jgi:hypothetical protein
MLVGDGATGAMCVWTELCIAHADGARSGRRPALADRSGAGLPIKAGAEAQEWSVNRQRDRATETRSRPNGLVVFRRRFGVRQRVVAVALGVSGQ